jgi:hypothetical protein
MRLLSDDELRRLRPAETAAFAGPIPTQIVSLRRLEIPEDMRKQHGYAPLGAADGPVKNAILGENIAALYGYRRHAELSVPTDRLAALKAEYAASGEGRSNLRHGYVLPRR